MKNCMQFQQPNILFFFVLFYFALFCFSDRREGCYLGLADRNISLSTLEQI